MATGSALGGWLHRLTDSDIWWSFKSSPMTVTAAAATFFIIAVAFLSPVLAPHTPFDPATLSLSDGLKPPVLLSSDGDWTFPLGTDDQGRDILSSIMYGTRLSLLIGLISVAISLSLGVVLGLLAGYVRGWVETTIMRLMDVMLSLPSLLLAIAVVAILGPGLINAMYAIAIVLLPHYVRLARAAVIAEAGKEYVQSSKIAGAGALRLMFNTILPNCLAPLIVQATLGFSSAILDAAALGFLGLGAQPPTPEWGSMLADALEFIQRASWVVTFPGLAILVTVLAFNLMGDGLRDALDPKLKR